MGPKKEAKEGDSIGKGEKGKEEAQGKGGKVGKQTKDDIKPTLLEEPKSLNEIGKFYYPSGATYEGEWIFAPDLEVEEENDHMGSKDAKEGRKNVKKVAKEAKDNSSKKDNDKDNILKNATKGDKPQSPKSKKEVGKDIKEDDIKDGGALPKGNDESPMEPILRPNRMRHGKGVFIDGEYRYEGEWQNDKMCGQGTFKYASGASYEGTWNMDKYSGKGLYKWADGQSYNGDWQENKMHGSGVYMDQFGKSYVGHFYNGIGPGLLCEIK